MALEKDMTLPIPDIVKKLWDVWNLRGGVLLSLGLQVFLALFASRRQRSKNTLLLGSIWLAYLVADWVAAVAIGLITKSQGSDVCDANHLDRDLLAFWASFLLVHLGGPDSITSFALEDNEFWLRHLVSLVLQVLLAAYSLFLTLPQNKLLCPTILVLVIGIIKFAERTIALYLASSDHFAETASPAPNPGIDYEEAVAVYSIMRSVEVSTHPQKNSNYYINEAKIANKDENQPISADEEIKLLEEAHSNFERFKGLIVGFLLSSKDRDSSRKSFLKRSPNEAFRLIEYELSFIYQVLHTKVVVVRRRIGYVFRAAIFFSVLAASGFFYHLDKAGLAPSDVALTYALLAGAVSVEALSIFNLVFSKRTWIAVKDTRWLKLIATRVLALRGWSDWSGWSGWSRSVSQYNAIKYCLDERPAWLYKLASCLYFKGILVNVKIWSCSSSVTLPESLKSFVFRELRAKSLAASSLRDAAEACAQRGDWALLWSPAYDDLKWSVGEFQYAESLLLWHIATELCYKDHDNDNDKEKKLICKVVSDYMFWLLVSQPPMLAPVLGNWHIVFQDTCADAKRFFAKHRLQDHSRVCGKIDEAVRGNIRPAAVKGSLSKSVLFDASFLANKLRSLEENKWSLMSRVWVELLSYAAINCRPIVHAQQPSKGGELLTFTWLLMNHLGLGTQFNEQEQQAGTKLVPTK